MSGVVQIEMFLDVSCPWCHGALGTNRRLLDELGADPELPPLELQWRFLRLHDDLPSTGLPLDVYFDRFAGDDGGDLAEHRAGMRSGVDAYVASVGARVDWERYTHVRPPLLAHRLLALVRDDGRDDLPDPWSLARVLFSATFVGGVDLTDHAAVRRAVEQGGLQLPERVWSALDGPGGHLAETLADRERALQVGLDGVPRMRVGDEIVPTWIDPDEVRGRLRAAIGAVSSAAAP